MINLPPYNNDSASKWAGLTLQEIQMRRAIVQARMEVQKFKLSAQLDGVKERTPFLRGISTSFFSRIFGVFSFAEYALFGVKIFKFFRAFRKK